MDRSAERADPLAVAGGNGDIRRPEPKRVLRRLVQSTLFPHKSPVIPNCDAKVERESNVEECGQEEECCESQGKRKRARKGKTTTPPSKSLAKTKKRSPTPRKDASPLTKNGTNNGEVAANSKENENASPPPIPNLMLEAKFAEEEISRVFTGERVHPLFLSRKLSKKCQEMNEAESNSFSVRKRNEGAAIGPIHVFEKYEDDHLSFDWGNWNVREQSFIGSHCAIEDQAQCISQQETPGTISATSSDVQLSSCNFSQSKDMEFEDKACHVSGHTRESDFGQQCNFAHERIVLGNLGCADQLDDRLWTDKYQPQNATEVCGNGESIKILSEWLNSWHQKGIQSGRASPGGDKCSMQDDDDDDDVDYYHFQSDSDSENIHAKDILKNVLLITGPVGSGKSAAVYACAKEQQFKVLEANASESRNGAFVKQKLGEAVDSHSFQWSQENLVKSLKDEGIKCPTFFPKGEVIKYDDEEFEVMPITNEDKSHGRHATHGTVVSKDISVTNCFRRCKTLILFEDVDIIFPQDRGFIGAIQQIAEKAKGPVILTSNSDNPFLPDSFDRLEVCFSRPSNEELLQHVNTICSAEKVNIPPDLVAKVIECCQQDIRKSIMLLQFWCQGKHLIKGTTAQLSNLHSFDLEVGHQMLPKIIPWGFPSQLSELVDREISSSLLQMEERPFFTEVIEEYTEMHNKIDVHIDQSDSVVARKKLMFSRNSSDHDWDDFTLCDAACDLFNSSSKPVSFSGLNKRRKLAIIMSSDSEEELPNDRFPNTSSGNSKDELVLEVDGAFPAFPSTQNCPIPSNNLQLCCGGKELEESDHQSSGIGIDIDNKGTCKSTEISYVPESSFVPETECNVETEVLCSRLPFDQMPDVSEVSMSNGFEPNLPVKAEKLDNSTTKLHGDFRSWGTSSDVITLSNEEVDDSQNNHVEAITREYHVMDECSCMDLTRKVNPVYPLRSSVVMDLVRESWRKLRNRYIDLRQNVASEHKDASRILGLTCDTSNLISEVSLLLFKCQPQGSMELSMAFSDDPSAFSWCCEQFQMASTFAEHGFYCYAKDIAAAEIKKAPDDKVDLGWGMLSTASMMEIDRLFGKPTSNCMTTHSKLGTEMRLPEGGKLLNRESKKRAAILQSIVPSRSYMTMKGDAFYEYLSSLGRIARSEALRLSDGGNTNIRRPRTARHYLSTGSLMLSPEEIPLLGQYNIYGKFSSQSTDTNIK